MSGKKDPKAHGKRIADAAKAVFIDAVCAGARVADAAAVAGHTVPGFQKLAKREAAFRAGWNAARKAATAAMAAARAERWAQASGELDGFTQLSAGPLHQPAAGPTPPESRGRNGEERIASNNRRVFQRRRMAHVRFDNARQALFLRHFAASCDAGAAAAQAGVAESTVLLRRHRDAAFQAAFDEALQEGYARLGAEALRQRLAAAARLRAAMARTGEMAAAPSTDQDLAGEFERTMKLLARWDRANEAPGVRWVARGRQKAMPFEEAIVMLDRKLVALGVRRGVLPADATEDEA
jgi:hypothetical protein